MSQTHEDITIPEHVYNECFGMYNGVLTFSKQKTLEKLIRHAYLAGIEHSEETDSE